MSSFRILHLRFVQRQPLRAILAAAAVAASVAMTVSSFVLIASIDQSTTSALKNFGGPTPLRIVGPYTRGGVNPALLAKVERTKGVSHAVPVVQAVAVAEDTRGKETYLVAIGVDCRIEALTGTFGCDKQTANLRGDGPALTSALLMSKIGEHGVIRTDAGRVPIKGAIVNDSLDTANSGRVAVFSLSTAQRLFDRGDNFDAIYVKPNRGVDAAQLKTRLSKAIGPQNFVLDRGEPTPWMNTRGPLIALLGLGVVMSLGLSALLVYNIMSLSLAERRRDIAVASAIGTSPRALIAGVIGEGALLGVIGGVFGVALGVVIAHPLVSTFASVISEQAMGLKLNVFVPLRVVGIGLFIGAAVGAFAALVPARRAQKLDLAAELHGRAVLAEDAPARSLVRIGALVIAGAIALAVSYLSTQDGGLEPWQPVVGSLSLIAMSVFVFSAVGALAPKLVRLTLRSLRSTGGPTRVAMANLVSRPRRTSVIATAIGAAVGMACVLGSLIPAIRATVGTSDLGTGVAGRVLVATLPLNNASNVDARPSKALVDKLSHIPGVVRLDQNRNQEISDHEGVYSVRSIEGVRGESFGRVAGDVSPAVLDRGEAVIGTSIARARGLRPGSTLRIATPDGFVPIRIAGIWTNAQDNGFNVSVSTTFFSSHFRALAPHQTFLWPAKGVTDAELVRRVEAAHLDPDLYAMTGAEATMRLADEVGDQVSPFWFLQRLLLFVALIGTLSTLLLVGIQRRRELGILGAVGFSPSSLGRMTLTEAMAAGLAGGILGVIGSVAVFETLRNAAVVGIGVHPAFRFDVTSAFTGLALAAVVIAFGGALPAWRTSRLQIVEAIRDE